VIVESLSIQRFRNLEEQRLSFHPAANLFVGDNGEGKTNLLEALYFLATTRSFRTTHTAHVIPLGGTTAFVSGEASAGGATISLSIGVERSEAGRRRELTMNGQRVPLRRYVDALHPIAYSSARLEILRGGPDARRRFVDRGIASIRPAYLEESAAYTRALQQRNALLAKIAAGEAREGMLDAWDAELAAAAVPLIRQRTRYVDAIRSEIVSIVESHDYHVRNLQIVYRPSAGEAELASRLRENRKREKAAGFTLAGPHRDEVEFTVRGVAAHEILSSGELKSVVLFLKLAKIAIFRAVRNEQPLFILDDIDAELDLSIIEKMLEFIGRGTQLFTSSAKPSFFSGLRLPEHALFRVAAGRSAKG
jgi:DNA replication and repair protein RecF